MWKIYERGVRYATATVVFAVGLTLSPRASLEGEARPEADLIPVNALQAPDCLWCEAPSAKPDCNDAKPGANAPEQRKSIWLSPDAPATSAERGAPCPRVEPTSADKGARPSS